MGPLYTFDWLVKVTSEVGIESVTSTEIETALNSYFAKLGSKLRSEGTSREILKNHLERRTSDLLERIDELIVEVESKVQKPLLVIIDGLDKPQLEVGRRLFVEHAEALVSPCCKIIFTFPLSLLYSVEFGQLRQAFDQHFVLPNIMISHRDGTSNSRGRDTLKELVSKRMEPKLVTKDALDNLLQMSGGVLREFVRLVQSATIDAVANDENQVKASSVNIAADEARNMYRRSLRPGHYQELFDVHRRRGVPAVKDVHLELLHNLSLLEYRNDETWFAVNPLLIPLIEEMSIVEESS